MAGTKPGIPGKKRKKRPSWKRRKRRNKSYESQLETIGGIQEIIGESDEEASSPSREPSEKEEKSSKG